MPSIVCRTQNVVAVIVIIISFAHFHYVCAVGPIVYLVPVPYGYRYRTPSRMNKPPRRPLLFNPCIIFFLYLYEKEGETTR
jgi:hypothetical protein